MSVTPVNKARTITAVTYLADEFARDNSYTVDRDQLLMYVLEGFEGYFEELGETPLVLGNCVKTIMAAYNDCLTEFKV